MAWLSGLADKAENLLNKIDKNTAAVLNKDKYDLPQPTLTEVTWISPESRHSDNGATRSTIESPRQISYANSTPDLPSLTLVTPPLPRDDELLTFLNTPDDSPRRVVTEPLMSPSSPNSLLVEHPTDSTDSVSEMSMQSNCSSTQFDDSAMDDENVVFVNGTIEEICNGILQEQHYETELPNEYVLPKNEAQELKQKDLSIPLSSNNSPHEKKYANNVMGNFDQNSDSLGKQETEQQKENMILNEKIEALEQDKQHLSKYILELQSALERNRLELNCTRSDLEQHKARAFKTLQEKEKLIAELRCNEARGMDDVAIMELNQLRQERDVLREENLHVSEQLRIAREELMNADIRLEKMGQKANDANIQAQEILTAERRRRLDAEEDAKIHSEEVRSLKDELLRQRNTYTKQLQKQNSEIGQLRMQLSSASTPSDEMESRLATLTQTLVLKQQDLESLTTERNALRLQIERIEHEFRNMRHSASYNNINDTDDAKAQVPTFLLETPFDTGVTRRVKRAYSTLDAISIRTGVFLRRYPLARILVLIYMALLQFWVLVVLLSQSPEAH